MKTMHHERNSWVEETRYPKTGSSWSRSSRKKDENVGTTGSTDGAEGLCG